MNLVFHYHYPAAGEGEGENTLRRSLCRELIFYFSNIPTSRRHCPTRTGCHRVKSMVDQRQHITVVTGAGHLRLMSPPFQGAPFGKGEAQDYKVSSRGQRTRSCVCSQPPWSLEPRRKGKQTGFRRAYSCVAF